MNSRGPNAPAPHAPWTIAWRYYLYFCVISGRKTTYYYYRHQIRPLPWQMSVEASMLLRRRLLLTSSLVGLQILHPSTLQHPHQYRVQFGQPTLTSRSIYYHGNKTHVVVFYSPPNQRAGKCGALHMIYSGTYYLE